ncbi:antibiotic biosynthesis monooxygenase [Desulfobacula sp.]|uniref:putative quinol monooxygenase n=1 Tax=Desulfobacula sp. TaxID=2593537 RepID=UPI0026294DB8|nr:antibiotic biosynthesis monooxygenase [Desulfobacula sp.]
MIIMTQILNVKPKKRKEFIQTICDLMVPFRKINGCINLHCYQSIEDQSSFILISKWKTQADMDAYMKSDEFEVLQGAKTLLKGHMEQKFDVVSFSSRL